MSLIKQDVFGQLAYEKLQGKSKMIQLATTIDTLSGTEMGDTVVFPYWKMIGMPEELVKGQAISTEELEQDSKSVTISHIAKGVSVFDSSNITHMGNQIEAGGKMIGDVFARKIDEMLIDSANSTPLQASVTSADTITEDDINQALLLFGDEMDVEDMEGIVINSLLVPSFLAMPGFVDAKTFTTANSGIQRNGLLGAFRGIEIFVSDVGTYKNNECITYIVKKGALGIIPKKGLDIELSRDASKKKTDIYADYYLATSLMNDAGVIVLKASNDV